MDEKLDITPELVLSAARVLQNWCKHHRCSECPLYKWEKCMVTSESLPFRWRF